MELSAAQRQREAAKDVAKVKERLSLMELRDIRMRMASGEAADGNASGTELRLRDMQHAFDEQLVSIRSSFSGSKYYTANGLMERGSGRQYPFNDRAQLHEPVTHHHLAAGKNTKPLDRYGGYPNERFGEYKKETSVSNFRLRKAVECALWDHTLPADIESDYSTVQELALDVKMLRTFVFSRVNLESRLFRREEQVARRRRPDGTEWRICDQGCAVHVLRSHKDIIYDFRILPDTIEDALEYQFECLYQVGVPAGERQGPDFVVSPEAGLLSTMCMERQPGYFSTVEGRFFFPLDKWGVAFAPHGQRIDQLPIGWPPSCTVNTTVVSDDSQYVNGVPASNQDSSNPRKVINYAEVLPFGKQLLAGHVVELDEHENHSVGHWNNVDRRMESFLKVTPTDEAYTTADQAYAKHTHTTQRVTEQYETHSLKKWNGEPEAEGNITGPFATGAGLGPAHYSADPACTATMVLDTHKEKTHALDPGLVLVTQSLVACIHQCLGTVMLRAHGFTPYKYDPDGAKVGRPWGGLQPGPLYPDLLRNPDHSDVVSTSTWLAPGGPPPLVRAMAAMQRDHNTQVLERQSTEEFHSEVVWRENVSRPQKSKLYSYPKALASKTCQ